MILLVGLGNPGPRYASTRHNAGVLALSAFASRRERGADFRERFEGRFAECEFGGTRLGLLKPETFMNHSGRSVRAASSALGLESDSVLVLHDELDIPFGQLRLKRGGGDGGHRGLRSISAELGSPDYGRVRVGIGRPPLNFEGDVADFVLQAFAFEEQSELERVLVSASQLVEAIVRDGFSQTMNRTNQRTVR